MICYCGLPVKAKGLCAKHYLADYRKRKEAGEIQKSSLGSILIAQSLWSLEKKKLDSCVVSLCYNPVKAKGVCSKHYLRLNRHKKKANQK